MITERQQRAAERIMEDEGLTANLTDAQAAPLLMWATAQVSRFAIDPQYTDAEVDAAVTAIRRVIRDVTRDVTDASDLARLIELAEKTLADWTSEQYDHTPTATDAPPKEAVTPAQSILDVEQTSEQINVHRYFASRIRSWFSAFRRARRHKDL